MPATQICQRALLSLSLLLGAAGGALAQAPQQTAVFPPGGQLGTTVAATIHGANLQGATAVLVSGEGVAAKITNAGNAAALQVEFAVAPNAEAGSREVRVVTPRGMSNAEQIFLDAYPRLLEKEPNNASGQAQLLDRFPVAVCGQANGAEDVDWFTFDAGAGETWVFDLYGARHGSGIDGYMTLRDAQGRDLKTVMETSDLDPRLVFTFQTAGKYTLLVRDKLYRGGVNFTYSMAVGKLPVVMSTLPLGGKRGETVEVALDGVNLGEMKSVRVRMPADPARESVTVVPMTASGPANPITLYAGDLPEASETEPNETTAQATRLPGLPVTVSGRIGGEGDRDVFVFAGQEKQQLVFELWARRLGSRLDSVLRLLDKDGKEISSNDDAVGKDSRITYTVPATADYYLEVRSLDMHGSLEHPYRLQLKPPTTDFSLNVSPDNPNLGPGGSAALTVQANRVGYAGEIALRVEGLPAGVASSPVSLRAGQNQVSFTLTAANDAALANNPIRVVGEATIDSKQFVRVATPAESVSRGEGQPPLLKPTRMNLATVTEQQQYALQVDPLAVSIVQGQNLEVTLRSLRKMGFNAAINLAVLNNALPPGVTAELKPIPQDQNEVKIKLTAAANAGVATTNLIFTGNANNVAHVSQALAVTVTAKQ